MRKISVLAIAALIICSSAIAATPPQKLLVANYSNAFNSYRTLILASNPTGAGLTMPISEPSCLSGPPVAINGYSAALIDPSGMLCSNIVLIDAPLGIDARSIVHFREADGSGESSYVVPRFGAATVDQPSIVGPVINNSEIQSYLILFASEPSAVTLILYSDSQQKSQIGLESFALVKGVNMIVPKTQTDAGYLEVELGYAQFGVTPSTAPVYGFVCVSTPKNGNAIVYPLGQ